LWYNTYICVEISQKNSLSQTSKNVIFLFIFCLLQNQKTGGWNRSCPRGGLAPLQGGRWLKLARVGIQSISAEQMNEA
jgi:hypothetical protein